MSKTFDNIAEASSTNYLFLKAQMTISLAQEPPTPPPLYALSFPSELLCAALWVARWLVKRFTPKEHWLYKWATRTDPDTVITAHPNRSLSRGETSASLRVEATKKKVEATRETLATAVTQYVTFHQADVAQEERWRTTMQRRMDQNFRNIKASQEVEMKAIREQMNSDISDLRSEVSDLMTAQDANFESTWEKTNQNFEDLQTTLKELLGEFSRPHRVRRSSGRAAAAADADDADATAADADADADPVV